MDVDASPEQVADLLQKGIDKDFESLIRERLQAQVEPIISELARDLAKSISASVQMYKKMDRGTFDPQTVVHLRFNSDTIQYTSESPGTP